MNIDLEQAMIQRSDAFEYNNKTAITGWFRPHEMRWLQSQVKGNFHSMSYSTSPITDADDLEAYALYNPGSRWPFYFVFDKDDGAALLISLSLVITNFDAMFRKPKEHDLDTVDLF